MESDGSAIFLDHPLHIGELTDAYTGDSDPSKLQRAEQTPYKIIRSIDLDWSEFQHFITDMLAERWFLEKYHGECASFPTTGAPLYPCLLIVTERLPYGVLVMPDGGHVGKAAIYVKQ